MCQVKEMRIDNRTIHVADIKQKYISNIIDAAKKVCFYRQNNPFWFKY